MGHQGRGGSSSLGWAIKVGVGHQGRGCHQAVRERGWGP